jgi:hypothetical protein
MLLSFARRAASSAAEVSALKTQLESAKRRITELTLENIQQANEIVMLKDYRGTQAPEPPRPILAIGRDMVMPEAPANSEIGLLFSVGAV